MTRKIHLGREFRMPIFLFRKPHSPTVPACAKFVHLHPGRLTWNLQINHLERKMIFQTSMIMFHVNLPGCKTIPPKKTWFPRNKQPTLMQKLTTVPTKLIPHRTRENWSCVYIIYMYIHISLEVQPPCFKGYFQNYHYFSRGLSSSERNHHFQNGGWLPGYICIYVYYTYICIYWGLLHSGFHEGKKRGYPSIEMNRFLAHGDPGYLWLVHLHPPNIITPPYDQGLLTVGFPT